MTSGVLQRTLSTEPRGPAGETEDAGRTNGFFWALTEPMSLRSMAPAIFFALIHPQTMEDSDDPEELQQQLKRIAQTRLQLSIMIWGPPGIGKTALRSRWRWTEPTCDRSAAKPVSSTV